MNRVIILTHGLVSILLFGIVAHGAWAQVPARQTDRQIDRQKIGFLEIDRTEVTIHQFEKFAQQTKLLTEAEKKGGGFEWGFGWERKPGWTFRKPNGIPPVSFDIPVVHLTWHEAAAYCKWAGGRLPTMQEWKIAAYTETRSLPPKPFEQGTIYKYPTGDDFRGANFKGNKDGYDRHAPAGKTKQGVNGLYDMAGNVWEWVAEVRGNYRFTMGGSFFSQPKRSENGSDRMRPASFYAVAVGFRCVYDPKKTKPPSGSR